MSLKEQITEMQQKSLPNIPPEVLETMQGATKTLAASGIAGGALKEGEAMPAFSLPNANGETVSSGDLLGKGPLVISFYRGGWCPYCNLELKALQEKLPEIKDLGASLVAVTPETPNHVEDTGAAAEVGFEVLSDVGNKTASQMGIVFTLAEELQPLYAQFGIDLAARNGDDSQTLPMPATFVVDRDGKVVKAFVDADYTQRLEPDDVLAALKGL